MKKIIVLSVIALFICVGFQSAFAVESNVSVDNIENEEDCDCKSNDKIYLAEKLLNQLEKNEILSDIFDFTNFDDRPICILLENALNRTINLGILLLEITDSLPHTIFFQIFFITAYGAILLVINSIIGTAELLNCV